MIRVDGVVLHQRDDHEAAAVGEGTDLEGDPGNRAEPTDRDDVTRRYEMVMALVDPNAPPRIIEVKPSTNGFGYDKAAPAV